MGRSDYDLYYSLQNCLHEWGGGGQDLSISKKNKKNPGSSPVPDWYLSSIKVKFPSATSMLCSAHHPIDQTHKITAKKRKKKHSLIAAVSQCALPSSLHWPGAEQGGGAMPVRVA